MPFSFRVKNAIVKWRFEFFYKFFIEFSLTIKLKQKLSISLLNVLKA